MIAFPLPAAAAELPDGVQQILQQSELTPDKLVHITLQELLQTLAGWLKTAWGQPLQLARRAVLFLLLAVMGLFMALPLIYSVINSFKPVDELFAYPPRFFVVRPTGGNYFLLFKLASNMWVPFSRYLFNSVFVTVISMVGYVLLASMAAYALSKHRFPLKNTITKSVVFAILFRPEVTSVPLYILMVKAHIIDNYWALILPAMSGSFGVFLLQQFLDNVPNEMIEAARIDGASEFVIYRKLIMPMLKPAWMTVVIFTFISIWNTTAAQFIYSEDMKMLPAMLSSLSTAGVTRTGVAAAVGVLMMFPSVVIFLLSQNSIVETMAHSGLKG